MHPTSEGTRETGKDPLPILWGAITTSVVIYGAIAFLAAPPREESDPASWISNPIVVALHAAGLAALVASFIVPGALRRRSAGGGIARARQSWILRWAMIEACAIFGLVAAFILSDARAFLVLGALALTGLLLAFPRSETDGGAA